MTNKTLGGEKLRFYIDTHTRMKYREFAEKIGVCAGYLSGLMVNRHPPSQKLARRIEVITGGKVKASDFFEV